jgi:ribosome production factor 2
MFGFSSKKRPNSLILGRTFDNEIIDMFEFNIEKLKFMEDFKVKIITIYFSKIT